MSYMKFGYTGARAGRSCSYYTTLMSGRDELVNSIVANGRQRLEEAYLQQLTWEVAQEYAAELQHATWWQRRQLHRRIAQEVQERSKLIPLPSPETLF